MQVELGGRTVELDVDADLALSDESIDVEIYNNWFYQKPGDTSVRSAGNTRITNNAYGLTDTEFLDHAEPEP